MPAQYLTSSKKERGPFWGPRPKQYWVGWNPAAKGSRDAVVLLDGSAFVVSVKNKTVITAVDAQSMREHVFTNIDSAVIA